MSKIDWDWDLFSILKINKMKKEFFFFIIFQEVILGIIL